MYMKAHNKNRNENKAANLFIMILTSSRNKKNENKAAFMILISSRKHENLIAK